MFHIRLDHVILVAQECDTRIMGEGRHSTLATKGRQSKNYFSKININHLKELVVFLDTAGKWSQQSNITLFKKNLFIYLSKLSKII